jgi:hypothetical protein
VNHIFGKYIGRLRTSLNALCEEEFVNALVDLLKTYKVFSFLRGEQGPIGPAGPTGPTGSSNRIPTIVTANRSALLSDGDKLLIFDATAGSIVYTINPATVNNTVLELYRSDGSANTVTIATSSGIIQLRNWEDQASYPLVKREPARLVSDGTNIIQL